MKRVVLAFAAVVALSSAVPASAGPIVVNGGWYGFCFDAVTGAENGAYAGCSTNIRTEGNPFTFLAVDPVLFKITDGFLYGDMFRVEINGGPGIPTSPAVVVPNEGATSNPDDAFNDLLYSKLAVPLGPGSYSINVFYSSGTGFTGVAFLEVESAAVPEVPVPDAGSTLALFGLGMIGLGTIRRKLG